MKAQAIKITFGDEDHWSASCAHGLELEETIGMIRRAWKEREPKEPLIKDEKIRKAVRAWAEACGLSYATYKQASNEFYDPNTRGAFAIKFKLIPVEVYLEDGECYTIAELCGEGEECEN